MALTIGTRIGSYEIKGPLGEGGMGVVYRASDTKLRRDVAVKLLPENFADHPERLSLFQREAQVLAALNHPNIAQIYGLEESDGARCIVMELVEGETLADRLKRGPIPLREALPIAAQIVTALEAAHEKGIIHRDLKPANVKLAADGAVKVLDFGLAKTIGTESSDPSLSNSPTMMSVLASDAGIILGTAAYMSPEQASGRPVDKRTDLWAFGVVLLEMLTGRQVFSGETVSHIMAAVLMQGPDWTALPSESPEPIRRLLRRCLEKDRRKRLGDAGDARLEIEEALQAPAQAATRTAQEVTYRSSWFSRAPWIVAAAMAIIAAIAAGLLIRRLSGAASPESIVRFHIEAPELSPGGVQVSPNGRQIVIAAGNQLHLRALDSADLRALPRTQGATYPFWSPEGAWVGFFADGRLKKISVSDGLVQEICAASNGRGAAWSRNGTIVFSSNLGRAGLLQVSASGGQPQPIALAGSGGSADAANADDAFRYPYFLPDGAHFLYSRISKDPKLAGVYVAGLNNESPERVLGSDSSAVYASSKSGDMGYLLFMVKQVLMSQAFDSRTRRTVGQAFPLVDGIGPMGNTGYSGVSVSNTGVLAEVFARKRDFQLVWRDRSGTEQGKLGTVSGEAFFSLSPDGRYVAIVQGDSGARNIGLTDLATGSSSLLTSGSGRWAYPVWSPTGMDVGFSTPEGAGRQTYEIRRKAIKGVSAEQLLLKSDHGLYTWDWSPDGRSIMFSNIATTENLFVITASGGMPVPFAAAKGNQNLGQFSPDGRWAAYTSDESGSNQVYVRAYPSGNPVWQVSAAGGMQPRWRRDGSELYFVTPDGALMAAPILSKRGSAAAFEHGPIQKLFDGLPFQANSSRFFYQPFPDGRKFIVTELVPDSTPQITMVVNWPSLVEKK